jgi:hypothetical protein
MISTPALAAAPPLPGSLLPGFAALAAIHDPGTNCAIWSRDWHGCNVAHLLTHAPFLAAAEDVPEAALRQVMQALPCGAPATLAADIGHLARLFVAVAGTKALRIRLEAFAGPGCHRWHADAVGLRLLCTYAGEGTDILPLAGGAKAARRLDPTRLPVAPQRLGLGQPAILKGEGFAGNAGQGCIHRSPPNSEAGPPRLLVCLDEPGRIPLS